MDPQCCWQTGYDGVGAEHRSLSGSLEVKGGVSSAGTLDPQDRWQTVAFRQLEVHIGPFQDHQGADRSLLSGLCASRTVHRLRLKQAEAQLQNLFRIKSLSFAGLPRGAPGLWPREAEAGHRTLQGP